MKLKLKVRQQNTPEGASRWETYEVSGLVDSMSILEVLDKLNEQLVEAGEPAISFESDCREGICGACGITVNGVPHGPERNTPVCHQRVGNFADGATVTLEPFQSASFPVIRDLIVDRSPLDTVTTAGGYVAVDTGTAPDAQALPASHEIVEAALDYGGCLGCGACVAACPNGSAHLFLGAQLTRLALLPLPALERKQRATQMVTVAESYFGPCSSYGECAVVCPSEVPLAAVAAVNHERLRAQVGRRLVT